MIAAATIFIKLGIDLYLTIPQHDVIKDLIGECFALQNEHKKESDTTSRATNQYFRHNSRDRNHPIHAVSINTHQIVEAFKRYHREQPYVEDVIKVFGKWSDDGAKSLLKLG